ncbi:hypothetical protein [Parapedobacter sp. 10938]|uniref:hypothetical protein n=1 Tax=Parapedobacter flavus TaxID=3110225 RepID=UPI002DB58EE9|nr:hypothetical protein [Parapedobacter sp. 10938]MEC3879947.1 hypothetical protein [Parapedobacter sp. 10938]
MKASYSLLTLLTILLFNACKKSDIEHEGSFERSYQAWLDFKATSGDSYRYEVSGATWAGSSWLTTITVREGKIVQRDFRYMVFNSNPMPDSGWESASMADLLDGLGFTDEEFEEHEGYTLLESLQWTENESELGLHEVSPASAVQTLDDIYERARSFWLKKRPDAAVSFEAKNNGLISSAGFVPDNCMDDCFSGISIRSIEAID